MTFHQFLLTLPIVRFYRSLAGEEMMDGYDVEADVLG
jgi:hypothetical protein